MPPSTRMSESGSTEIVGHGIDQVGDLERHAFECGPGEVGDAGGPGQPEDARRGRPAPSGVRPVRSGGDENQLVVGVRLQGEGVDLG